MRKFTPLENTPRLAAGSGDSIRARVPMPRASSITGFTWLMLFLFFSLMIPPHAYATEGSLKCSPTTKTLNVGDTLTVDYILDTRNFQTFGANIVATFSTDTLTAASQSTPVLTNSNWGQPITNTVDGSLGKISLDYGSAQPSWTGNASIGQMQFTAKAAGQAQFNFYFFQPRDDTTPGVAKVWGKLDGSTLSNILSDVSNCIYVIEAGTLSPTTVPVTFGPTCAAPSGGTVPTSCPTNTSVPKAPRPTVSVLPRSGMYETTVQLLGVGGFILLSGVLLPVFLLKNERE